MAFNETAVALGPSAFLRHTETTGTEATDSAGNYNGTYNGGYTLGVAGLAEDGDTAVQFDGTGYVFWNSLAPLLQNVGITGLSYVGLWKPTVLPTGKATMFSAHTSTNTNIFYFYVAPDGKIHLATLTQDVASTVSVAANESAILSFTIAPSGAAKIFKNSELIATGTITADWSNVAKASLGQEYDSSGLSDFFTGVASKNVIYSKVLTETQIGTFETGPPVDLVVERVYEPADISVTAMQGKASVSFDDSGEYSYSVRVRTAGSGSGLGRIKFRWNDNGQSTWQVMRASGETTNIDAALPVATAETTEYVEEIAVGTYTYWIQNGEGWSDPITVTLQPIITQDNEVAVVTESPALITVTNDVALDFQLWRV